MVAWGLEFEWVGDVNAECPYVIVYAHIDGLGMVPFMDLGVSADLEPSFLLYASTGLVLFSESRWQGVLDKDPGYSDGVVSVLSGLAYTIDSEAGVIRLDREQWILIADKGVAVFRKIMSDPELRG